jgi:peptide/nickel transport system ATP-binding protein
MAPLLEFQGVSKVFTRGLVGREMTVALDNVSFTLDENKPTIMTVAGESGSGKTTLANLLLGLLEPSQGVIRYKGKDIKGLTGDEKVNFRKEVQAVFQDPFAVFNPFYHVDHLLQIPIEKFKLARNKQEASAKMEEALSAVGLRPEDVLGRYPHQLSGGQRQRINVARALLLKPKLIVADEPVSMVDASLRATILESLRKLTTDHGISIVYITHDLTTAFHVAKSIMVLYRGGIMEAGDVDTVIKDPIHPYTRKLIDSIPWPDITRRWGENVQAPKDREGRFNVNGCKFSALCPFVTDECRAQQPPLYRQAKHRASACYLHKEHPVLPAENLTELMPT